MLESTKDLNTAYARMALLRTPTVPVPWVDGVKVAVSPDLAWDGEKTTQGEGEKTTEGQIEVSLETAVAFGMLKDGDALHGRGKCARPCPTPTSQAA